MLNWIAEWMEKYLKFSLMTESFYICFFEQYYYKNVKYKHFNL